MAPFGCAPAVECDCEPLVESCGDAGNHPFVVIGRFEPFFVGVANFIASRFVLHVEWIADEGVDGSGRVGAPTAVDMQIRFHGRTFLYVVDADAF